MTACLACREPLTPVTGLRVHPGCDTDPDALATELFGIVERAILDQPRSQQKRIGPSELGVPCDRRLGFKLAGIEPFQAERAAWKPYVGTAVHEQMATVLAKAELRRWEDDPDAGVRWHVEERVSVGEIAGTEVTGSCDLFDEQAGAVWDWKFTTRNQVREHYRPHGPGEQYRVQAHLYGRGWQRAGYQVRTVGIVFMTRDGELADRHVWHEPYDEAVAIAALERAGAVQSALDALGPDFTIPTLPTADAHCRWCPWHSPAASPTDSRACAGHATPQQEQPKSLTQLIGA